VEYGLHTVTTNKSKTKRGVILANKRGCREKKNTTAKYKLKEVQRLKKGDARR